MLVYKFGTSLKVQPAGLGVIEKFPFKPLNVINPQAISAEGSGIWDNQVDNYQQINAAGIADAVMSVAVYKHSSSPAAVKPYSILITGLKATNSALGTTDIRQRKKLFFMTTKKVLLK